MNEIMSQELKEAQQLQDSTRPTVYFYRFERWHKDKCHFCGTDKSPYDTKGAYYALDEEEEIDYLFCGNCQEEMEKYFDMVFI